jgi:hypothetical protein
MIQALEEDGKVAHIDGSLPVDEVHRKIVENLQSVALL